MTSEMIYRFLLYKKIILDKDNKNDRIKYKFISESFHEFVLYNFILYSAMKRSSKSVLSIRESQVGGMWQTSCFELALELSC